MSEKICCDKTHYYRVFSGMRQLILELKAEHNYVQYSKTLESPAKLCRTFSSDVYNMNS